MNWVTLKDKVYYLDGSLRDIIVSNTTKDDWKIWVDFINKNYKTSFYVYETEKATDKIDYSKMLDYWNGKTDCAAMITIYLDNIIIKCNFFDPQEIENDIAPKEFISIADHKLLMTYMKGLSKVLNKKVILTPENSKEVILLSVDNDQIIFGN